MCCRKHRVNGPCCTVLTLLKLSFTSTRHPPLSPPHTRANGWATGRLQQAAHVGNAREPRVRINYTRIWPRATVRQISVVFDMFRLVQPRTHLGSVVCEGRQLCSEKKCDTGQWKGIVCTRELKMTPSNDVLVSDALLEDKFVTIWPDYPCLYDVRSVDFRNKICYRRPWKL